MGQTNKAKITFTCSHEVREALERRARAERRTLSNLVEGMIEQAIAPSLGIHQLVAINLSRLESCGVANLEAIVNGAIPSKPDFCKIAACLGLEGEEKKQLWDSTYKEAKREEGNASQSDKSTSTK